MLRCVRELCEGQGRATHVLDLRDSFALLHHFDHADRLAGAIVARRNALVHQHAQVEAVLQPDLKSIQQYDREKRMKRRTKHANQFCKSKQTGPLAACIGSNAEDFMFRNETPCSVFKGMLDFFHVIIIIQNDQTHNRI